MKYLIIAVLMVAISGCASKSVLDDVRRACMEGYIQDTRIIDEDSLIEFKCKSEIYVNINDFKR